MALTVGDVLPFSAEVRDAAGALADAGTMTLTVTLPDGTAAPGSPFTVTSTSLGIYDRDITSTIAGRYVGYWLATGLNAGAHPQVFHVRSAAETALVSLGEVKDHLNIPLATTTHDQELERKIGSATTAVEYFCGPVVRRTPEPALVSGGGRELVLPHNQVVELTSLTPVLTSAPTVTIADLHVHRSGRVIHKSGLSISWGPLQAVYIVGRTEIPDELIEAALIIVAHLWDTQRGPRTRTFLGQENRDSEFVPALGFAIPHRAMDLMKLHPAPAGVA